MTAITKATVRTPPAAGGEAAAPAAGSAGQAVAAGARACRAAARRGDNVFAISSGGMVHLMNPQIGTDQTPPVKFLPPMPRSSGRSSSTTSSMRRRRVTAAARRTASGPSISSSDAKTVTTLDTKGARWPAPRAPTFGTDGTLYVATGGGDSPVANAVVSLDVEDAGAEGLVLAGDTPSRPRPSCSSTRARI